LVDNGDFWHKVFYKTLISIFTNDKNGNEYVFREEVGGELTHIEQNIKKIALIDYYKPEPKIGAFGFFNPESGDAFEELYHGAEYFSASVGDAFTTNFKNQFAVGYGSQFAEKLTILAEYAQQKGAMHRVEEGQNMVYFIYWNANSEVAFADQCSRGYYAASSPFEMIFKTKEERDAALENLGQEWFKRFFTWEK
jgi:hypothetical protein